MWTGRLLKAPRVWGFDMWPGIRETGSRPPVNPGVRRRLPYQLSHCHPLPLCMGFTLKLHPSYSICFCLSETDCQNEVFRDCRMLVISVLEMLVGEVFRDSLLFWLVKKSASLMNWCIFFHLQPPSPVSLS